MPRLRSRAALTAPSAAPTASSTRSRRGTVNQPPPSAVIERSSPEDTRQSIHLTVKASPNKLRKATSGPTSASKTAVSSRNIVSGKRASRSSRVIQEVDSDEEDEVDEEPDAMDVDEDEDEEDEDAEGDDDDDVDAEGDEDDDMEDASPGPRVVATNETIRVKPSINVTKPQDTVEAKEMAMQDDDDDEELSELDSEEEAEEDAEGEDEDAEGEDDDEIPVGNDDEDEDEDMESDNETPGSMSRDQTPDLSKLTRRQRAIHNDDSDGALLALSNEAQKKKHLTAEEHAMRRAEMARRRKNLSEKRNEEEKMDTINRLLKKQPPKRGRRVVQEINESGQEDEPEVEKADPLYIQYIQNESGSRMGVPDEWLQAPVGSVFTGSLAKPSNRPFSRRMVEEVS